MCISGDPSAAMIDQHQPAEHADFIAAIDDHSGCRRQDRRALGRSDIQPVIDPAPALRAEPRENIAPQRPGKTPVKPDVAAVGVHTGWLTAGHNIIDIERERCGT